MLGNNEAKYRTSNNQMHKQWSQHGQKYQWFQMQNRGWVLMSITAKGHGSVTVWTREWQLQCCDLGDGREVKPWKVSTVLLVLVFSGGQHQSDGVPKQCTHPPLWGHFASRGHRWYRSSHCPPSYRLPAAEEWGNLEIGLQLLADTTSGSWCLGPGAAPTSQSSLKC